MKKVRVIHKQRAGTVKETFTVEADAKTMERFKRLLWMLDHTRVGHTGTFAMSVDGDGWDYFKVHTTLPDYDSDSYNKVSGAGIEYANNDGFSVYKP